MTLAQFHSAFVYNRRRRRLLVALLDELAGIAERSTKMRVVVFGSFMTDKEMPGDVDALVCAVAKDEFVLELQENGFPRRQPDDVDMFTYLSVRFLFTPERLVDEFNTNYKNRENQVVLENGICLTDVDDYRERMKKGFLKRGSGSSGS